MLSTNPTTVRALVGAVVGEGTKYMITPGSQNRKTFPIGLNPDGSEKLGSFTTATFSMEDCPRKAYKQLRKTAKRLNKAVHAVRKVKGSFGSRRGTPLEVALGATKAFKPLR